MGNMVKRLIQELYFSFIENPKTYNLQPETGYT